MQERERLKEGFWPASRVEEEEADHMDGNGRVGKSMRRMRHLWDEGATDQGHHLG